MTRNPAKYQAIIKGKTQELPKFSCDNTIIPITNEIELLGVTVDDKLKFENHRIRNLCRKVSQQTAVSATDEENATIRDEKGPIYRLYPSTFQLLCRDVASLQQEMHFNARKSKRTGCPFYIQ